MNLHHLRSCLLGALALWLGACSSDAQTLRIDDGYLTPEQAKTIRDSWPKETRQQLIDYVYSNRFNRQVRPCGEDPALENVPAVKLSGKGFKLPRRHRDDLSCALVEAGIYLLGERGRSSTDFVTLVGVADGERVLEIEVQRDEGGVVQQVYGLHAPDIGRLLLRPRPDNAPGVGRFGKKVEREVSASQSLDAVRALLGNASFDLSVVGFGLAPDETDPKDEPGCAETGKCPLLACGPAPSDQAVLRQALFSAEDKREIVCPTLERWQTERHRISSPTDNVVRRALVIAAISRAPESDTRRDGVRIVTEHSTSGTRFVGFSELLPGLVTTPVLSQTVRKVEVIGCEGDKRRQRCEAKVALEVFSRVVNMPRNMPQTALVESLGFPSRSFEKTMTLEFRRRNARWELQDAEKTADALFDLQDARITKTVSDYLVEKLRAMPPR
ncbi:MAG: hypothetical protein AAGA68_09285 [Pseudomonadota bacterium]